MKYTYETHIHTCLGSACGKNLGSAYIEKYKSIGFAGIIFTDHFFNGNCAVPKDLPWEERVTQFCRGYEEAKREADRQNFSVFFSWECNFDGDEYLVYGLDKEWLLENPDILEWDHITHYQKVKEAGGLVIQAHPFRERGYLSQINLHPFQCDGWEVANAGNPSEQDVLAYAYANSHNMIITAGSDMHNVELVGDHNQFGVSFDTPLTSIQDYVKRIKAREGTLAIPQHRLDWTPNTRNTLPLYLYDQQNTPHFVQDVTTIL